MIYKETKELAYQDISEVMDDIYNELKGAFENPKHRNSDSTFSWEEPDSLALDSTNFYKLLADWHAKNLASENLAVIIFSSQLPIQSVVISFLSFMADVSLGTLRSGKLAAEDWRRLAVATGNIENLLSIFTFSGDRISVKKLKSICIEPKTRKNIRLIIVTKGGYLDIKSQKRA